MKSSFDSKCESIGFLFHSTIFLPFKDSLVISPLPYNIFCNFHYLNWFLFHFPLINSLSGEIKNKINFILDFIGIDLERTIII